MAEEKPVPLESKVREELEQKASKVRSMEDFQAFFKDAMELEHDYGSICVAIGMVAKAAATMADRHENGGITGFQAGAVMWEFMRTWNGVGKDGPVGLTKYENLMYPQYEKYFQATINKATWDWAKEEAKKRLEKDTNGAAPAIIEHWKKMAEGIIPFGLTIGER